jgi:3-hydroxyacyl-[acyl-carrier-protein] dehydratase
MSRTIDINQIMNLLPHRYPFLLVDRVEIVEEGKKAVGYKNVTINEQFFQGHFPGNPIMPGVLILEAMAQVGAVILFDSIPEIEKKLVYFLGMDKIKFRGPVLPGDVLRMEVDITRFQGKVGRLEAKAFVGDKLVTEAVQTSMVVDRDRK